MKYVMLILAGISLFFGVLFIWGSFGTPFDSSSLIIGIITTVLGLYLLYLWTKSRTKVENVYKIDLPGKINIQTHTCSQCGSPLNPNDFKMVNGTPTVHCDYCGAVYEVAEDPKW